MTTKQKTEVKVSYMVFELTDGGTLREPVEDYYGRDSHVFDTDGYETQEQAIEAISKVDGWASYVVLMVVNNKPVW